MVVVLILGERGDVYGPTLAARSRVSLAVGRWCRPGRSYARRWRGSRYVSPVPAAAPRPRSAPRRPRPAGRRAVTSFRHAPCLAAPGVPLRYRLPACAAPVTGRASSSLRSGTSRARCSVVGDVKRPRHGNALPILAAARLARSPCRRPPPPLSHKLRSVAGGAKVVAEVGSLCASGSGSSHAQPLSVMPTLIPRAKKTPRCSRNLLEAKFRANAPCGTPRGRGVLVSLSPAAVPGGPDTDHASKAVMVCASCPGALAPSMRHLHRAKRWRRLVAGSAAKRLPWCRAWRDFFEFLTGSPQALSAAVTALLDAATCHAIARSATAEAPRRRSGRPSSPPPPSRSGATGRPGSKSCGRRPHATPPTGGSLPRARIFSFHSVCLPPQPAERREFTKWRSAT